MRKLLNKTILACVFISSQSYASFETKWLVSEDDNKKTYITEDVESLFLSTIENSYKINQIREDILSQEYNKVSSDYYFLPKITISSELKQKMDRPGHPSKVMTEFLINLSARIKLWSDTVSYASLSELKKLESRRYDLNNAIVENYSVVNKNLVKIEISRSFLDKSFVYKEKMQELMSKMEKTANVGLIKNSDRVFANVTMKKFEESIININSQIEGYKSEINNLTAKELYNELIGLNSEYIDDFFELGDENFKLETVLNRNFDILSRKAMLESDKNSSKSLNETVTFELVTQHDISENKLSSKKNENNVAENGYTYDNDGESYVGLKLTYTGFDFSTYMSDKSEEHSVTKKMIEMDEKLHQINVDLNTQKLRYSLTLDRLNNIDNQIKLTLELIDNLIKEISIDESNVLDLFRNISSLSDLEMNRLSIRNELTDIVSSVRQINSMIPSQYVSN
ncbi:TPA: hypothetical protein ACGVAX_000921 [Vibrio vulnificus]